MKPLVLSSLLASLLATASAAAQEGSVARAQNDPSEREDVDPAFAFGAALMAGVDVVSDRQAWNAQLESHGHEGVPGAVGDAGLRLSFYVHGFELSFAAAGQFYTSSEQPATNMAGTTLYGELSYDTIRKQLFTFGPSIGAGWYASHVCVQSSPKPQAPTDGPFFDQLLANPGRESCLEADSMVVRGGLVAGLVFPTPFVGFEGTGFLNLRPTLSWPVWSSAYTVTDQGQFGSFAGPTPPHPSFGASLELGFILGGGRRSPL